MATTNILPKFKQNLIKDFLGSLESPITSITVNATGSNYANGDALVFSSGSAAGVVVTSGSGGLTGVSFSNTGSYSQAPTVTITTATGIGGSLSANINNDNFYMFVGRSLPFAVDTVPDPNFSNDYDGNFFQHEQMYFGLLLSNTNFSYMIPQYTWTSNTVYAEYDDKDQSLSAEQFYVVNSSNTVYKCIDNNNGAPSTIAPFGTQVGGLPPETSDGYRWMYMFQLTGQDMTIFSTPNYIPVVVDANVSSNAIDGGIFNIKVLNGGSHYPASSGVIGQIIGQSIVISANASTQSNYYANCTLTVFGVGNLVTNLKITASSFDGTNIMVSTANTFNANQVSSGDTYQIAPTLVIGGTGEGADGYLTMNPATQSIVDVQVISAGSGYSQAAASVVSGTGFGTAGSLRAVISPEGGHGSDVINELFSEWLGVGAEFSNTAFSDQVTVRAIGIMKNPAVYGANTTPFTGATFNQLSTLSVANTSAFQFSLGETILGNISGAHGDVAFCNSSIVMITGYTGAFIPGEILNGVTSKTQYSLISVVNNPSLAVYSGDIIYVQNIDPAPRSVSSSEQIKLVLQI